MMPDCPDRETERRIIEDAILETMACPREMVFGEARKETATQARMGITTIPRRHSWLTRLWHRMWRKTNA